jgi:hypothetical protein
MFVNDVNSRCGVHEISIPLNEDHSVRRKVIVDDHIPCLRGVPIIAHNSNPREYWVPLLVKAIAKLCGGYGPLINGFFEDHSLNLIRNVSGIPDWVRPQKDHDGKAEISTDYLQFYSKWTGFNRVFTAPVEGRSAESLELDTTAWPYNISNIFVGEDVGEQVMSTYHLNDHKQPQRCLTLAPTVRVDYEEDTTIRVVVTGLAGGGGEHVSLIVGPMTVETRGVKVEISELAWIDRASEIPLDAGNGIGEVCRDIRLAGHLSPFRIGVMVGSWDSSRRFGLQIWSKSELVAQVLKKAEESEEG